VLVRDLVARGTLRLTLAPLLDSLPVAGAARVCFLEAPAVSYRVSSFGSNPMVVPGLEAWLNCFIREQVTW
jgi:Ca2+-dependent lipid-binding protein